MQRITVLGGDLRQRWLAERLMAGGFDVTVYQVPQLQNTYAAIHSCIENAQVLALPFPALTADGQIRAQPQPITLRTVLECAKPGTVLFGGMLDSVRTLLESYRLKVFDYAESSSLATANAVPTAEGAVQLAMEHLPITLAGSRCLVIGYGRIGKVLSDRLLALGAQVTVAARKPEDLALAEALGCQSDRTGLYLRGLQHYDCVFNTVPAPVLRQEHLRAMQPDCLIIDLASAPGGLADVPQPLSGPVYMHAPGLPGKVAPRTAAQLLRKFILETLAVL